MHEPQLEYAGFWIRVWASLIDSLLLSVIIGPLLWAIYGKGYFTGQFTGLVAGPADLLLSWVLPAVAVILFWLARQATPGKMVVGATIVDAQTGGPLSPRQSLLRYLGYYLSLLPLCLGFLWIAFDGRKQGWHDKLAGTVVVVKRPLPVSFSGR